MTETQTINVTDMINNVCLIEPHFGYFNNLKKVSLSGGNDVDGGGGCGCATVVLGILLRVVWENVGMSLFMYRLIGIPCL